MSDTRVAAEGDRVTRCYVDVPWGQAHVTTAGEGPPLLLLHSMPRSAEEFRGVLGRIAGRTCVAIDLPGLGASDPLPGPPSVERWADAVWTVCDQLGLGPIAAVGHHGGGVVGMEMAASRPDDVECLVLSSTPWIGPDERAERRDSGVFYGFAPRDDLSHILQMAERRRSWMPAGRPELWNGVVVDVLRARDPEAPLHAIAEYRMEDRIGLVTCPTLVLARRGDIWFAQRDTMAARLARAEVQIVEGTILVEDRPDVMVDAVQGFLSGGARNLLDGGG